MRGAFIFSRGVHCDNGYGLIFIKGEQEHEDSIEISLK